MGLSSMSVGSKGRGGGPNRLTFKEMAAAWSQFGLWEENVMYVCSVVLFNIYSGLTYTFGDSKDSYRR